jgi:hypothetical protein
VPSVEIFKEEAGETEGFIDVEEDKTSALHVPKDDRQPFPQ